jgi:hypothetical protein
LADNGLTLFIPFRSICAAQTFPPSIRHASSLHYQFLTKEKKSVNI